MKAFFAGMLVSLSLALSVGPGLALQFQASVQRGFFGGIAVIVARYISDATLLSLSYIGVLQVVASSHNQILGGIAGSVACIVFGLTFLLKRGNYTFSPVQLPTYTNRRSFLSYFLASIVINTMNPFVVLYWLGLVALAGTNFGVHSHSFIYFFSGLLSMAIVFDLLKCYIFSQIKMKLKPRYFRWVNKGTGIALLLAGIMFLGKMLFSIF
jgi:threonine/homoserine/homoserine lactone efflux protein